MAKKKKEQELTYLQMPIPPTTGHGKMTKVSWGGINYRNEKDTGEISAEKNVSTSYAPYLAPSQKRERILELSLTEDNTSLDLYGVDDIPTYGTCLLYCAGRDCLDDVYYHTENHMTTARGGTYQRANQISFALIDENGEKITNSAVKTGQLTRLVYDYDVPDGAKIQLFKVFSDYSNIADIEAARELLMFPHGCFLKIPEVKMCYRDFSSYDNTASASFNSGSSEREDELTKWLKNYGATTGLNYIEFLKDATSDNIPVAGRIVWDSPWVEYCGDNPESPKQYDWQTTSYAKKLSENIITGLPKLIHACVAHQRIFGIDRECVYASGFNDYTNWNLDTADEYSAENAWMSSTQSGSGGVNTGIINYSGNVYVFKRDTTFEITNTKNPFRIHEVFQKGAISQTAVCVVGSCLIFVSHDAVMLYNGSSLKDIGYNLGVSEFYSAVTGTDGRKLYLYCKTDKSDGSLFVYDSYAGLWSEEAAESEIKVFTQTKNGVYTLPPKFFIIIPYFSIKRKFFAYFSNL